MLNEISLLNFKSFQELPQLKIKPITILCGVNSCGKSSIIQSILLMKQTLESQTLNQVLLLNGRFIHLGTFENCIYEKQVDRNVRFTFSFKITERDFQSERTYSRHTVPINYILMEYLPGELGENSYIMNKRGRNEVYEIVYNISLNTKDVSDNKNMVTPINVEQCELNVNVIKPDGSKIPGVSINITQNSLNSNEKYNIKWNNVHSRFRAERKNSQIEGNCEFTRLAPSTIKQGEQRHYIPRQIYMMDSLLSTLFAYYSYIGPLRVEPSRRYIYEDDIVEIGIKGENAPYIYLTEKDNYLNQHFFFDPELETFDKIPRIKLSTALNRWLNLLGMPGLSTEIVNEIIRLNFYSSASSPIHINVADMGFGVSQIFPIILEGLRMPTGTTLLLEQPEIHLHPNLQMRLGDYLISLGLSHKNVIVETHSDHLINRLVRRIVEDKQGLLKDLIGIYFFSPTPQGTRYEEVIIDEYKGITNWPKGFCDQTANENEKIIKAGIEKRLSMSKE